MFATSKSEGNFRRVSISHSEMLENSLFRNTTIFLKAFFFVCFLKKKKIKNKFKKKHQL